MVRVTARRPVILPAMEAWNDDDNGNTANAVPAANDHHDSLRSATSCGSEASSRPSSRATGATNNTVTELPDTRSAKPSAPYHNTADRRRGGGQDATRSLSASRQQGHPQLWTFIQSGHSEMSGLVARSPRNRKVQPSGFTTHRCRQHRADSQPWHRARLPKHEGGPSAPHAGTPRQGPATMQVCPATK